jgi:hypothetical protein
MPIEAILSRSMPEPFPVCPKCGAMPFESFLRGQVVRSSWYWHRWWFRRRTDIWCVICRACKEIVGHEGIEGGATRGPA